MSKVLLEPSNRMLLKFQRKNIIETTTSSSDSDDHKYDTMKMLDNKKDLLKLSAIARIRRSLKYYEKNKLKNIDKDLLKGLFLRRPK